MQGTEQRFRVSRWTTWKGQADANGKPDLRFVPAMLRRRLSRLSSLAVSVANTCLQDETDVPTVFASQHGELGRTADLLVAIGRREPLSPTAFSLSVHNSATGLLTLTRSERAAASAIAGGMQTVAMGILEAFSQARERNAPVLLICADTSAPGTYNAFLPDAEEYAFAVLITPGEGELVLEFADGEPVATTVSEQIDGLADVIGGNCDAVLLGDSNQAWRVRRDA